MEAVSECSAFLSTTIYTPGSVFITIVIIILIIAIYSPVSASLSTAIYTPDCHHPHHPLFPLISKLMFLMWRGLRLNLLKLLIQVPRMRAFRWTCLMFLCSMTRVSRWTYLHFYLQNLSPPWK
ncbi:hypothetical protein AMECASPLE_029347 [Ameca splendens]|uniref:Uncharacterized protein n=1 Tax=Ameca splendens TaxID=208324 RepID=A0ABV0ZFV0_9TELE